jgi:hypothetical protein
MLSFSLGFILTNVSFLTSDSWLMATAPSRFRTMSELNITNDSSGVFALAQTDYLFFQTADSG